MKFWTYEMTGGTIQINAIDGAMFVSIETDVASSGSCNVTGGIPFKNIASSPVARSGGNGLNFSALSPESPLDGITIEWTGGIVYLIVGF